MHARQVVAVTKFVLPRTISTTIVRSALVARLDESRRCPLTLVAGPPGAGKTTLLVQWVEQYSGTVAWLSCDATDADGRSFWESVVIAVRRAWRSVGSDMDDLLSEGRLRDAAVSLANDLAAAESAGAIVIDDYHYVHGDGEPMSAFVEALPPQVRVVLGSRVDPVFPLGRLRLQGRLCELRQDDLRLDREETRTLLGLLGVSLTAAELETLAELTEGWTAGVHLAGLWLQRNPSADDLLRRLVETDRSLVDFLMNEVIDLQPPALVDFLEVTAEVETFDAALCNALTGHGDGDAQLGELQHRNLFLVPLDWDGRWYRYHRLFGQFLRARLRASDPTRVSSIHRAAALCYQARGDLMSAFEHRMSAGDATDAIHLLSQHAAAAESVEGFQTAAVAVTSWLRHHGRMALDHDPRAVAYSVIILNSTRERSDLRWWLEQLDARWPDLDHATRLVLNGVWSFFHLHEGRPDEALTRVVAAKALRDLAPVADPWLHSLVNMLFQSRFWLDDLEGAQAELDEVASGPPQPAIVTQLRLPAFAAHAAYAAGDLVRARHLADQARAAAREQGLHELNFGLAEPALVSAGLCIESNDFIEAEAHLEHLMRITGEGRRPQLELLGQLEFATLAAAAGDEVAMAVRLEQARALLPDAIPPITARIDAHEARLALDRGDVDTAMMLTKGLGPSPGARRLRVRIHLACRDVDAALALLASDDASTGRRRSEIERHLLMAQALGDVHREQAQQHLRAALILAEPVGFERTIVSEGAPLWGLLESLAVSGRLAAYVGRLLGAADRTSAPARRFVAVDLVEPLSQREITVLRYLASRLPAREIATTLYISGNTVRSHVKAIYRKLEVNCRADAVERARQLGLLAG
jgi:LuxR family maltose regulon positive regulatory protein